MFVELVTLCQALFWAWEDEGKENKPRSLPLSCSSVEQWQHATSELSMGSKCWGAGERQGGAVGVLEGGAAVSVWSQGWPLRYGRFDA